MYWPHTSLPLCNILHTSLHHPTSSLNNTLETPPPKRAYTYESSRASDEQKENLQQTNNSKFARGERGCESFRSGLHKRKRQEHYKCSQKKRWKVIQGVLPCWKFLTCFVCGQHVMLWRVSSWSLLCRVHF